jgi:hypothetical protein
MFSKGQLIFAILFFITFVIGISWAYLKDKKTNMFFYKGSYKILVFALFVFFALFGVVKMKNHFFP